MITRDCPSLYQTFSIDSASKKLIVLQAFGIKRLGGFSIKFRRSDVSLPYLSKTTLFS